MSQGIVDSVFKIFESLARHHSVSRAANAHASLTLDVDPLVGRVVRSGALPRRTTLAELEAATEGLSVWRRALAAGRVPDYNGVDSDADPWPPQPLLGVAPKSAV